MSLSYQMTSYIATGLCPNCLVMILSPSYVSAYHESLVIAAEALASPRAEFDAPRTSAILTSPGVKIVGPMMQCQTCRKSWVIGDASNSLISGSRDLTIGGSRSTLLPAGPPVQKAPEPFPPEPPRQVDLSKCRLLDVADERQIEKYFREERKRYPNNSSATVTREISISSSIKLAVTTESSKLRSHNAVAGITLVGFGTIQGQVQQQLSERYAVTLESTLTVSENVSATIPPYSTIEHIIQWKVLAWAGIALLGKPQRSRPSAVAEVPYEVPLRLTFDHDFVDAEVKKKEREEEPERESKEEEPGRGSIWRRRLR
jgi:hypothetical protein